MKRKLRVRMKERREKRNQLCLNKGKEFRRKNKIIKKWEELFPVKCFEKRTSPTKNLLDKRHMSFCKISVIRVIIFESKKDTNFQSTLRFYHWKIHWNCPAIKHSHYKMYCFQSNNYKHIIIHTLKCTHITKIQLAKQKKTLNPKI